MCGGAIEFKRKHRYKIRFKAVNNQGKVSEQLQLKRLNESSIFQLCLSKNIKKEIQGKLKPTLL